MHRAIDDLAFLENLYTKEYKHVYRLATIRLRFYGMNESDAADITQDVFILCARRIDKVKAHPNPAGWLAKATYFISMNHIRKRAASKVDAVDTYDQFRHPDDQYAELDALVSLEQLLSPEEYALFKAYCIDKRPAAQICRETGISENLLRVRIHRLRKYLSTFFVLLVIFASARNI